MEHRAKVNEFEALSRAGDERLRQVGIYHWIENTQQKRCVCGFGTCASIEPRTETKETQVQT